MFLFALLGALALAAIPLTLGWRRTVNEAQMARALGISLPHKGFDPERLARQSGTGLTFRQLAFGGLMWTMGGGVAGWVLGPIAALLFALAGGLLYFTGLATRRQEVRMQQAKDLLRGLGLLETLLAQGRPLEVALDEAAQAVGPAGGQILRDLVVRYRAASAGQVSEAVRAWTRAWEHPAVEVIGTALLAALEGRIEIAPLMAALRKTLNAMLEVLARARAAARGLEWQTRFLALFPPGVLVAIALTTPEMGRLYAANPLVLLPVLLGSAFSYLLSMRMIRNGLSLEASLGLQAGKVGEIRLEKMGRVL